MSTPRRSRSNDEDFPVTGSLKPVPDFLVNDDLPELDPEADGLLADLNVLMAQRPGDFNFRTLDLMAMNDSARRQLLIDMREALGIRPLGHLTS